jgi:hypothetical protein
VGVALRAATELMLMTLPPSGPKCFTASSVAMIGPRTFVS